jgi:hypothetical protein
MGDEIEDQAWVTKNHSTWAHESMPKFPGRHKADKSHSIHEHPGLALRGILRIECRDDRFDGHAEFFCK